ncbi:Ycf66 family protein [Synechococcus sp. PCC 7336]|uniref:Ycf66 family protein n=1 Tax=Synechococcus sp. PCC 7336 TaxID=195250 RepID=UPI00034C168E|nr:Ycf66 family protein [Synechococcus sp. PCC 7336]
MFDPSNPVFQLGVIVLFASVGYYTLRFLRPLASREYDVIVAIIGMVYAVTLMWEGYRLIPLLAFAQLMLVSISVFFAVETFRLRLQLTEKARQAAGGLGGSVRRGPKGFTKTYRPEDYDSRRMSSRSGRSRMRDAEESDRPRRRPLRSANGSRPRLSSTADSRRSTRRPRPTRPPARDSDFDAPDEFDRGDRSDYPSRRDREDYPETRRRRPARTTQPRPSDFDERDDYDTEYPEERFSNGDFADDDFTDEPPSPPRRSSRPTTSRRQPPRMPDDIEEPASGPTRPISAIDVEGYDSEDDEFDDY